jgi:RimJ/RimL family protein N-acetyltransferase
MEHNDNNFVRPINYSGLLTNLGPISPEHDLPFLWQWINDPEVAKYTLAIWPTHLYAEKEYVENLHKKDNDATFALEAKEEKKFIGMMGLHNISYRNGTAVTGAIIGDAEFRGKRYGGDAKMHLLYHAFEVLGLRKVCSAVKAYNVRSLRYLKTSGYEVDGVRKEMFYFEGCYHDEILFSITWKDFLPRWRKYKKVLEKANDLKS